ncbi:MAG: DUF1080 domain-containing protein [Pirellulales bacterium]|nr:DUF1080 domain-containing protein [Pirellulales bacterium]
MSLKSTWVFAAAGLIAFFIYPSIRVPAQVVSDPKTSDADFALQGEYSGALQIDSKTIYVGVQVIALGDGAFQAVRYDGGLPGNGWNKNPLERIDGKLEGGQVVFSGKHATATLADSSIKISLGDYSVGELAKVQRKSHTLGKTPPTGATILFDGTSAEGFVSTSGGPAKMTDDGLLVRGANSKHVFGDCHLHVEFRLPFEPHRRGQGRGNSGVYVQGRYELQLLDSFGLSGESNECGGFYGFKKPDTNMCYPPMSWQTYDVDFVAAKYDPQGKKIAAAKITAQHNGVLIHDNVELPGPTPVAPLKESVENGFLHLQDHGNAVRYRNIWLLEKNKPARAPD